jgi:pyruvate carboxylase
MLLMRMYACALLSPGADVVDVAVDAMSGPALHGSHRKLREGHYPRHRTQLRPGNEW